MENKIYCEHCGNKKEHFEFSNKSKNKCRTCAIKEIYKLIGELNVNDGELCVFYFKDKLNKCTRYYVIK